MNEGPEKRLATRVNYLIFGTFFWGLIISLRPEDLSSLKLDMVSLKYVSPEITI